jgi:hypothetical protein
MRLQLYLPPQESHFYIQNLPLLQFPSSYIQGSVVIAQLYGVE